MLNDVRTELSIDNKLKSLFYSYITKGNIMVHMYDSHGCLPSSPWLCKRALHAFHLVNPWQNLNPVSAHNMLYDRGPEVPTRKSRLLIQPYTSTPPYTLRLRLTPWNGDFCRQL